MSDSYHFIESSGFSREVKRILGNDEAYSELQFHLAKSPNQGRVIPGAEPLRKMRWQDPRRGKGKRGGLRVIYLHFPQLNILYMLDVFGKDEADDLTGEEKKFLKTLAVDLEAELRAKPKGSQHGTNY